MTLGLVQLDRLLIDSRGDTWLYSPYVLPRTQVQGEKVLSVASKIIDRKKKDFFMQFKLFQN
jgi:hypothetical protein